MNCFAHVEKIQDPLAKLIARAAKLTYIITKAVIVLNNSLLNMLSDF